MENQIIITSGRKYIDIDAYSAMFAYKVLLQSLGYSVFVMTSAKINESVPQAVLELGYTFDKLAIPNNAKYIILDVSNPDFFDTFVDYNNIIEVIDHHTGYEEYWQNNNTKNQIEFIGSVCTIIFEKFIELKKENLLNSSLCKLLIAGILDNTLNLKSKNTTPRDIKAYNALQKIGNIDKAWDNMYFESCYKNIEPSLQEYIENDIKVEKVGSTLPDAFGQLIVLENKTIFNNFEKVKQAFSQYDKWMFNVIVLKEGKSYIFFSDNEVRDNLLKLFKAAIFDNYLILNNCMLRKEIMKEARMYDKENE